MKRADVKMGYGTDLLGSGQDQQLLEFELRADVLSAHKILVSATSLAAEILGQEGRLGVIAPDAIADLIAVDGDPLANVRIMNQGGRNRKRMVELCRMHIQPSRDAYIDAISDRIGSRDRGKQTDEAKASHRAS